MRGQEKGFLFIACAVFLLFSCRKSANVTSFKEYNEEQATLFSMLKNGEVYGDLRFSVMNKIVKNMAEEGDNLSLEYFLSDWTNTHPDDEYNSYWLFLTAYSYLEDGADSLAEYYFERIINNTQDLLLDGRSIHLTSLQNLIRISDTPANKITYLNKLLENFGDRINQTEVLFRLAVEYGREGDWEDAIKSYEAFLEREDASTTQIQGFPNAYTEARQLVALNNSSKDWTFETLDDLVAAVKRAITNYDWRALDRCKAKVNFFAMSWRQDETDANALETFSMRSFMRGNRIRFNENIDPSSTPEEAYLRTTGWSNYVNVWYLYFRKINFPLDPAIHGRWEWAGIYFGEKL